MTGAHFDCISTIIDSLCGVHRQSNLILINERSKAVIYQLKKSAGSCRKMEGNLLTGDLHVSKYLLDVLTRNDPLKSH